MAKRVQKYLQLNKFLLPIPLLCIVISNGKNCKEEPEYRLKTVNSTVDNSISVRSDNEGNIWLLIGTRSGFEGRSEIYFTNLKVNFMK